jgi:hypothetical protein
MQNEMQHVHHCWQRGLLCSGTAGLLGSVISGALDPGLSFWGAMEV